MLHANSSYKTNPSLTFSIFSHPMVPLKLESQAFGNLNFSFWGLLKTLFQPPNGFCSKASPPHPLWQFAHLLSTITTRFSFPLVSHSWEWERLLLFLHICSYYNPPDRPHPCLQRLHHYSPIDCLSLQFILPLWIHSFTTLLLEC